MRWIPEATAYTAHAPAQYRMGHFFYRWWWRDTAKKSQITISINTNELCYQWGKIYSLDPIDEMCARVAKSRPSINVVELLLDEP